MWNALPENIVAATSLAMFKVQLNDFDLAQFTVVLIWFYCFVLFVCSFFGRGVHVRGSCSPLCFCSSSFTIHFVNAFVFA